MTEFTKTEKFPKNEIEFDPRFSDPSWVQKNARVDPFLTGDSN